MLLVGAVLNAHNGIKMLFMSSRCRIRGWKKLAFMIVEQINFQYEHMQEKDVILHNIFTQSLSGPLNNESYKKCLPK